MPSGHPLSGEPDPECLVSCPYNISHRIPRKRLQFHLTKCRKSYPNARKLVCPFNTTHMINEKEFKFHLDVCPNKGIVDNFKYTTPGDAYVIELPPSPVLPPNEENWDDDCSGTYNPALKVAQEPILHTLIGGTVSEKRKCKVQQREKFRTLDERGPSVHRVKPEGPLRLPNTCSVSMSDKSTSCASMNNPMASAITETLRDAHIREKIAVKLSNAVPGSSRSLNESESSQESGDDFVVCKSKSRRNYRS